jgi:hypothetical protein
MDFDQSPENPSEVYGLRSWRPREMMCEKSDLTQRDVGKSLQSHDIMEISEVTTRRICWVNSVQ